MNLELPEYCRIVQRFEDGAAESRGQIDLAARPVAKAEPHDVAGHITRLYKVIVHIFSRYAGLTGAAAQVLESFFPVETHSRR